LFELALDTQILIAYGFRMIAGQVHCKCVFFSVHICFER